MPVQQDGVGFIAETASSPLAAVLDNLIVVLDLREQLSRKPQVFAVKTPL
jgi:hypothetical protein